MVQSGTQTPGTDQEAEVAGVDLAVAVDVAKADAEFDAQQFPVDLVCVTISIHVAGIPLGDPEVRHCKACIGLVMDAVAIHVPGDAETAFSSAGSGDGARSLGADAGGADREDGEASEARDGAAAGRLVLPATMPSPATSL